MTQSIHKILALVCIARDPQQPRKFFDNDSLKELTISIKSQGVIQPIIVRENPNKEGHYYIVAGERRYRAAKKAKLSHVPVIIRPAGKGDIMIAEVRAVQLTENFHREDLSLMEIFNGVKTYISEVTKQTSKKVTNKMLSDRFGQSATYWSRVLKIAKAPDVLLRFIEAGKISNINVISSFVTLNEECSESFAEVWEEMLDGNINSNLEKHLQLQVRMVKDIKKFGFVRPEPNKNDVYDPQEPAVKNLIRYVDGFKIRISYLQIDTDRWAVAHDITCLDQSCSCPLYAKHHDNNLPLDDRLINELVRAGEYVINAYQEKGFPDAKRPRAREVLEWINDELVKRKSDRMFTLPEKPVNTASQTIASCDSKVGAEAETQEQMNHTQIVSVSESAEAQKSAVLQDDIHHENVVSLSARREVAAGSISLDVPEQIQPELSRIIGYYHAVANSMSKHEAQKQIQMMVETFTGAAAQGAVH